MTVAEILALAQPALKRAPVSYGTKWVPAPQPLNPKRVTIDRREVERLVADGRLAWGNRCRSFVVRTPERG